MQFLHVSAMFACLQWQRAVLPVGFTQPEIKISAPMYLYLIATLKSSMDWFYHKQRPTRAVILGFDPARRSPQPVPKVHPLTAGSHRHARSLFVTVEIKHLKDYVAHYVRVWRQQKFNLRLFYKRSSDKDGQKHCNSSGVGLWAVGKDRGRKKQCVWAGEENLWTLRFSWPLGLLLVEQWRKMFKRDGEICWKVYLCVLFFSSFPFLFLLCQLFLF